MYALEFYSKAEDGVIKIPNEYIDKINGIIKIIVLKEEDKIENQKYKFDNLESILKIIKSKHIFEDIENPIKWQREIRNEW